MCTKNECITVLTNKWALAKFLGKDKERCLIFEGPFKLYPDELCQSCQVLLFHATFIGWWEDESGAYHSYVA